MTDIDTLLKSHTGPCSQRIHVPWKRLSAGDLDKHILERLRLAGKGIHFDKYDWREIDRMRRRLAQLRKEIVATQ
jgi:hypothetical protein